MKKAILITWCVCGLLFGFASLSLSTPTYYSDRVSFLDSVNQYITDDYASYSQGVYTNEEMSSVLGETRYQSISFDNQNQVGDVYAYGDGANYCAGCNGNFQLFFDDTSLSRNNGVYGVGLDIILHTSQRFSLGDGPGGNAPGVVLVEFGDGSTAEISVPDDIGYYSPEVYFLGITAVQSISSLTIGTEPLSFRHSWVIDNLTIASQESGGEPVPEPATMFLFGTALVGLAATRVRRKNEQ